MASPWLPLIFFLPSASFFWPAAPEVTRPTPTAHQVEDAQLAATKRHPFQNWSGERVSRVFLRLMPWLPVTQGRTYPFLGSTGGQPPPVRWRWTKYGIPPRPGRPN